MAAKSAEIGLVPDHWDVAPLITYLERITYGFTNPMPDAEVGPWKITAKDVVDGSINYGTARHTSQDAFDSLLTDKSKPKIGDVLLTKDGSIGRVAVVDRDGVCINQSVALLRPNQKIRPFFLKYLLLTPHYQRVMERDSDGSTIKHIYITRVDKMEVAVPPTVEEQDAILNVVKTLDDKIELNRRMNETLEAIVRAIFKSWFVDFDPVRAKANGEAPESICRRLGLTHDLLALFPAHLVDSDLGEIPEGWEIKPLEKITSYLNRGPSPKYLDVGGVLVLNQKCVRDGRVDASKGRRHDLAQRKVDGRYLEVGDVLVNSTGVGTLGRIAQMLSLDEPTIVDSHVTVVRCDPEKVSWNYFGVAMLKRQSEIEALGEGSTGQTELSRNRLGLLSILLPPKPLRDYFDDHVLGLRQHATRNHSQNITLANVRDAFLPKLLSGELPVSVEVKV